MKRNARYKGGSGTGVDLTVLLADGQQRPRHVDPGEALPTEIGGVPVDPDFVERLLEQESEWELAVDETPAQRKEREQLERDVAEQEAAGEAAAADHLAAAEKAREAAELAAADFHAAAETASADAIERVKAEQMLRGKDGP